jgi:hypothetical protein
MDLRFARCVFPAVMACALALLLVLPIPGGAAVVLTDLRVAADPGGWLVVSWQTASEINTVAFALLRSQSVGGPWIGIATMPATGGPSEPASYRFEDHTIAAGVLYYYMLNELVSDGGTAAYGPVSGVWLPATPTPTPTATPPPAPISRTWHLAREGSDAIGDGSAEAPFATIGSGIAASSDGDTVLVGPGVYRENITFGGKGVTVASTVLADGDERTAEEGGTAGSGGRPLGRAPRGV